MSNEHGEIGPQKLDVVQAPTTQTHSPERNSPAQPGSQSEAALLHLRELEANGADAAEIEHAKAAISEAVALELGAQADKARTDIANLANGGEQQPQPSPGSHLEEAPGTQHLRLAAPTTNMLPPQPARPGSIGQLQGDALAKQVRRMHSGQP
jgi:hypothetical protein